MTHPGYADSTERPDLVSTLHGTWRSGVPVCKVDTTQQDSRESRGGFVEDNWQDRAACRKAWVDPDWFHPVDGYSRRDGGPCEQRYDSETLLRARAICVSCPVRQRCWLENQDLELGVVAGVTETERQELGGTYPELMPPPPRRYRVYQTKHVRRFQVALYAFLRGHSIEQAAELAEMPPRSVRIAVRNRTRLAA